MTLPTPTKADDKVVLFDGVCRLCNGWSRFLLRHDKQAVFKLCTVQSPEGQAILQWFGLPTDSFETMLLVDQGTAHTKSDAFLHIMRQLPMPWSFLAALRILPQGVRNWCYDRVALNRYRLFGRYEQCMVPTPDAMKRFLGHG